LCCFVTARRWAGELAAEPSKDGRHLQCALGQVLFAILFFHFCYLAYIMGGPIGLLACLRWAATTAMGRLKFWSCSCSCSRAREWHQTAGEWSAQVLCSGQETGEVVHQVMNMDTDTVKLDRWFLFWNILPNYPLVDLGVACNWRKWKEIADDWVRLDNFGGDSNALVKIFLSHHIHIEISM
jgi:hypothetical protein